jgi:hypothetical protein
VTVFKNCISVILALQFLFRTPGFMPMIKKRPAVALAPALAALALLPFIAQGAPITPTDLNNLSLGAFIDGPVGTTVDSYFTNTAGASLGDIRGGVACPDGFATCVPSSNSAGTIYTYVYEIAPGVNVFPFDSPPNPSPKPGLSSPALDNVTGFRLDLAPGSNGVAGFDFTQATAALGTDGTTFAIELLDEVLTWTVSGGSGAWNTGEIITLFWQTTQAPSGPGKVYAISNATDSGRAIGPSPTPLAAAPIPGSLPLVVAMLPGLMWSRRRWNKR